MGADRTAAWIGANLDNPVVGWTLTGLSLAGGPAKFALSQATGALTGMLTDAAIGLVVDFSIGEAHAAGYDPTSAGSIGRGAGAVVGAVGGLVGRGGARAFGRTIDRVKQLAQDFRYKRSSGFRKGVRDQVWSKAQARSPDGIVRDPNTGAALDPNRWDMGHRPRTEFRKHQTDAAERGISRREFLDEHNRPNRYQRESPSGNRSHAGEDPSDEFWR